MSGQAAITARLGLDISEFKGSLNAARAAGEGFAKAEGGAKSAAGANEDVWKSENAVERAAISMSDGLVSAQSGAEATAKSMELLHKALKLPLGAAIGIGALAKLLEAAIEKIGEVKKATLSARMELNKPFFAQMGASAEDGLKSIDAILDKVKELDSTLPRQNSKWDLWKSALQDVVTLGALHQEENKALAAKNDLMARTFDLSAKIAENVRAETGRKEDASGSERETALLAGRLAMERKIREIRAGGGNADAKMAMVDEAESEFALATRLIEEKFAAKRTEIGLEENLLYIKLRGEDVERRSAEARVSAAKQLLSYAATDETRAAAQSKLATAEQAVVEATKTTAILREHQAIEKQIAELRLPATVKERALLDREVAALRGQLSAAKGDEARALGVEVAKKQEALAKLDVQDLERRREMKEGNLQARAGRGEAEEIRLKQAMLVIATEYFAQLRATGTMDSTQQATARAQLRAMKNDLAELVEKRGESVKAAQLETEIMRADLAGQDSLVKSLQIKLSYEEKIRNARKDQNAELVKELQAQERIAVQKQAHDLAKERRERLQLSLSDLAAEGTGSTGAQARRAAREEARARRRSAAGDIDGAKRHQERADSIKKGIKTLRESEKDLRNTFKGALDEAKVLQEIQKNTAGLGRNK